MIVKRLLQFNLLVSSIIAVAFILVPRPTLALYGIRGDNILYTIAQYFGTAHVSFAILLWLALRKNDLQWLRIIVISFFVGDLSGTIVLLIAQMRSLMNSSGWVLVGLSFLFAVGYGYGMWRKLPES